MFCGNCGKNADDGKTYCDNCANLLHSETEKRKENNRQEAANPKLSIIALVGFVLGCVSFLINFMGILGILALVLSIIGFAQINNNGEKGKGFAVAGMLLGAIGVIYGFITLNTLY